MNEGKNRRRVGVCFVPRTHALTTIFSYLLLFLFFIRKTAAARALMGIEGLSAEEVAQKAMDIASDMCVYTNKNFLSYTIDDVGDIVASVEQDGDKK